MNTSLLGISLYNTRNIIEIFPPQSLRKTLKQFGLHPQERQYMQLLFEDSHQKNKYRLTICNRGQYSCSVESFIFGKWHTEAFRITQIRMRYTLPSEKLGEMPTLGRNKLNRAFRRVGGNPNIHKMWFICESENHNFIISLTKQQGEWKIVIPQSLFFEQEVLATASN